MTEACHGSLWVHGLTSLWMLMATMFAGFGIAMLCAVGLRHRLLSGAASLLVPLSALASSAGMRWAVENSSPLLVLSFLCFSFFAVGALSLDHIRKILDEELRKESERAERKRRANADPLAAVLRGEPFAAAREAGGTTSGEHTVRDEKPEVGPVKSVLRRVTLPEKVDPESVLRGVAVALSGGGHRATLFGLGALLYMARAGVNRSVTQISSVSGGSLTNGLVAQRCSRRGRIPRRARRPERSQYRSVRRGMPVLSG